MNTPTDQPTTGFQPISRFVPPLSHRGSPKRTIFHLPLQTLGSPPDAIQGFGRVLLDSVLNVRGSVDLFVEDWVDMAHGDVHSHLIEMDGVSSSAFDGDMKVRETMGA